MNTVFETLTNTIFSLNDITKYTVLFLIGLIFVTVILRIALSIGYQSHLTMVRFSKKDRHSSLLTKIIKNYKAASEKGVANINTEQIVNKYMMRLNILGWSFSSIDGFITKIEAQAGFIGIATLFIPDTDKMWCVGTTAIMLLIFWFIGSIFDYKSARNKLKVELIDYVDNKEGVFYTKDIGSIIVTFKNELQSALLNTNKVLGDTINKLSININDNFKYGVDTIVKTTEMSMKTLVDYSQILKEPMNDWKQNIESASILQKNLNDTIVILNQSIDKFETIYNNLDKGLNENSISSKELANQIKLQIEQMFSAINNLDENSKGLISNTEIVNKQIKYIEDNQQLLDVAVQKYEGAIEEFTSSIANSFSNIVNSQSQNVSESFLNEMKQIINEFSISNKELANSINENMDKLVNQNIIQQQSITDIKESLIYKNEE